MTVQFVDIAGQKMAVLPVADYERLLDAAEDRADEAAASDAEQRRLSGETYLPIEAVDRILSGESALKLWREQRGFSQSELGSAIGSDAVAISRLELGRRRGPMKTWRDLADALGVRIDDIIPVA